MSKSVVGIDIGSDAIRAVEITDPSKPRPTVTRFHEVLIPEGSVSRGEVVEPNTIASQLKRLWSQGGFKSKDVVLGVGNQRVLARDLTVPKLPLERIRESLPFQVQDMLPVPVADALLDFYPVSESVGDSGPVINGLLIAAVKDAVLGNVKATRLAGLTTVEVDLIPFALSRALVGRAGREGSVVLIEVGAHTTSVVIVSDGIPRSVRIIPAGGADVTRELMSALDVDAAIADAMKRRLGLVNAPTGDDERKAVETMFRVTNDLLNSLRNTINYFVNTRQVQDAVREIVLTGGGAQLPGFASALAELTRLPVNGSDPFASVTLSRSIRPERLQFDHTRLSVALGLALGSAA